MAYRTVAWPPLLLAYRPILVTTPCAQTDAHDSCSALPALPASPTLGIQCVSALHAHRLSYADFSKPEAITDPIGEEQRLKR